MTGGTERSRTGSWRRERLARTRLYVVSGARTSQGDLTEFLEAVLAAGADIVQLREKEAEAGDVLRWAETFREAAERHGALFVINDRPDVAVAAGADGVHVGQNDIPVEAARRVAGADLLVGLSTHSVEERERASEEADYLCVGPIHATPTKEGRPAIGLAPVRAAARDERRVWFAIGGINGGTLPDIVSAGARRIVVVRAVTEAGDPAAGVRVLLGALSTLESEVDTSPDPRV